MLQHKHCINFLVFVFTAGPPGNPEIWWASISEGSVEGGDELGLIGKKFQSGEFNCFVFEPNEVVLCPGWSYRAAN